MSPAAGNGFHESRECKHSNKLANHKNTVELQSWFDNLWWVHYGKQLLAGIAIVVLCIFCVRNYFQIIIIIIMIIIIKAGRLGSYCSAYHLQQKDRV